LFVRQLKLSFVSFSTQRSVILAKFAIKKSWDWDAFNPYYSGLAKAAGIWDPGIAEPYWSYSSGH